MLWLILRRWNRASKAGICAINSYLERKTTVFSEYRKISSLIERIQNCFGSKEGTFNEIVCTFPASPSLSRDQGDRLSMPVEVALHGPGKRERNHDGAASQENICGLYFSFFGRIPVNNVLKDCRNPGNTDQTYGVFDAPRSNHRIDPAQYYCQQELKSITPGPNDDTIAMGDLKACHINRMISITTWY